MPKFSVVAISAMGIAAALSSTPQGIAQDPITASAVVAATGPVRITGSYIVVLKDHVPVSEAVAAQNETVGATVQAVYSSALHGYSARMTPADAERVGQLPTVQSVQADTVVRSTAQRMPTGINRANADASPTAAIDNTGPRVNADIAVIDTGVDLEHPDLNVFRAGATNCTLPGFPPFDENGHGTHVAGTIGARDNNIGVVGMAPGARIWPVKVLNATGMGSMSDVICGIDYVTAHADQIEVANMSLRGPGRDDGNCGRSNGEAMHQAICASVAAGVTFVAAAGNDSMNASNSIPAAYDEVITVSALADFNGRPGGGATSTCHVDLDDTFANYSNYGRDVDLVAPGTCIRSTWMGGGYATISGTSMATPHVAGAAALFLVGHPASTPARVRSVLLSLGSDRWKAKDDPDTTKEPLLDATRF